VTEPRASVHGREVDKPVAQRQNRLSGVHDASWMLDLCCCAGGATRGLQDLGYRVCGVDNKPQPNYCGDQFVQADALALLARWMELGWLERFVGIWASFPCQRWAAITVRGRENHPDLITPGRELLEETGLPWVMENVPAAPLRDPVMVCGGALGCVSGDLQLHRHRMFEANFPLTGTDCVTIRPNTVSVVGHGSPSGNRGTLGRNPRIAEKREAMGIDWTNRDELSEAIPPAYSSFIWAQAPVALEAAA